MITVKFQVGQEVLCRHPKHRFSLIGVIQEILDDQALVRLHVPIDNQDEYWFEIRCLRPYVK